MRDSVKFIFKTLFKIPVLILTTYAIFNIFAFSLTYFKLLGFSYVVMQTAVENNYIPPQEMNTLNAYLASITNTGVVDSAKLILTNPNNPSATSASVRRQYGAAITVGVEAHYKFIWPLMPKEQLSNTSEGFIGYGPNANSNFSGFASDAELERRRKELENNKDNNIRIMYTVPGLQYYPDLL